MGYLRSIGEWRVSSHLMKRSRNVGFLRHIRRLFGRMLAIPLLLINFCLYIAVLGITGWAFDTAFNGPPYSFLAVSQGLMTPPFLLFSLIAGATGVASILTSLRHLRIWSHESLGGSLASGWIAWVFTLVALGFAWKEINWGGYRDDTIVALEIIIIILGITQLILVSSLKIGISGGDHGKRNIGEKTTSHPQDIEKGESSSSTT